MIIRPAQSGDLPQLLTLYPYLNPADPIPSLEVAQRRLEELRKYPGSAVFIGIVDASTRKSRCARHSVVIVLQTVRDPGWPKRQHWMVCIAIMPTAGANTARTLLAYGLP
jgi:hypothetical protein